VAAGPGIQLHGVFDHVVFESNGVGVVFAAADLTGLVTFALRDCAATNNVLQGVLAEQSRTVTVMLQNATIVGNQVGVQAADGATLRISRPVITGNMNAYSIAPQISASTNGFVQSYGDNSLDGNSLPFVSPPVLSMN